MEIAPIIDYSLLKADVSFKDVARAAEEARTNGYAALCIPPYHVHKGKRQLLKEGDPVICTVIGFPMGYSKTSSKVEEIKRAIDDGADELDVVINIAAVKDRDWEYVENDINSMVRASHMKSKVVKVILETGLLTGKEIQKVCEIINKHEANFAKTSTGFAEKGADPTTVKLLRRLLNESVKIKASGGIRTIKQVEELLEAGVDRIGLSRPLDILT